MAASGSIPILLLILCFSTYLQFALTLSTFSISETSNQTLVCASTRSGLNCTSFPAGIIQIPMIPAGNSSVSGRRVSGLAAGDGFQCLLRPPSSNNITVMGCYRFFSNGTIEPYKRLYNDSVLDSLVAGNSHLCGLSRSGTRRRLECWQWPEFNTSNSQFASDVKQIAVGDDFVCGLLRIGSISCLGSNSRVKNSAPEGNYSRIAAGFRHVCAIDSINSSLACWGDVAGEIPDGEFSELALGENRSCGLRKNATVACWGESNFSVPTALRGTSFLKIEAKRSVFCGIESSNFSLYCWGNGDFGSGVPVFEEVLPGTCSTDTCPCGQLAGTGRFCSEGEMICQSCPPGPPLAEAKTPRSSTWNGKMVASLVVGCFGTLCLVLVSCFFLYKHCKCRGSRVHDSGPMEDRLSSQNPSQVRTMSLETEESDVEEQRVSRKLEKRLSNLASMGSGAPLEEFSLQTLVRATDNFSDDQKIGTGSFGSVYRGVLEDGREVAIKRAEMSTPSFYAADSTRRQENRDSAFVNELESLSRLNHKNLVRLLGYCEDLNELALVYEYMNNGTLHEHLHKLQDSPLKSWTTRLKVALDAARGIEYLHFSVVPSVIHRDIKSSNILLDSTCIAKVSDFGLSLTGPDDDDTHLSLHAAGTVGYIDPEYYRLQQLTIKSDVYSFGVVLLELLSGHKAIQKNENGVPRNVVDFVVPYIVQDEIHRVLDPNVPPPTPFEIEAVAYVGYLAADCVTVQGRDRPSMIDVVSSLETALAACLASPTFSPFSRSPSATTHVSTQVSTRLLRVSRSSELTPAPVRKKFSRGPQSNRNRHNMFILEHP